MPNKPNLPMTPLAHALAASPELFPAAVDPVSGTVLLWRLTRTDYEQSSFLDGRIAAGKVESRLPADELACAVDEGHLVESCHFILHIGHAGSTLLSRLLGRHPALFSLREPEILRTLATAYRKQPRQVQLPTFLKLWSRTFQPGARAVVKCTSFVSEIATQLLARPYQPRALAVGVAPEIYLATIFGGENAPAEARALAPLRLARLQRRLATDWRVDDFSVGEIVAMGWACETLCLAEAAQESVSRVLAVNFESFLADPRNALCTMFNHFAVHVSESEAGAILSGNEMRSYSKAPEYPYDTETRRMVLAEGRQQFGYEIRRGLAWLERAANAYPRMEAALRLFR